MAGAHARGVTRMDQARAPEGGSLSRADLTALRHVDDLTLRHRDGRGWFEAEVGPAQRRPDLRARERSVYGLALPEGRAGRVIGVASTVQAFTHDVDGSERTGRRWIGRDKAVSARLTLPSPANDPEWRTLVGMLRVGDRVALRWRTDLHGLAARAGLCSEDVTVVILRGGDTLALPLITTLNRRNSRDRLVTVAD